MRACVCVRVHVAGGAGDRLATAGEKKENTAAGREERTTERRKKWKGVKETEEELRAENLSPTLIPLFQIHM